MAIKITVQAESRAEKAASAYNDQVKHGYNPNYVNPKTRRITVISGKLPANTRAWECRVTRRSDGRVFRKSDNVPPTAVNPRVSTGINLPSEGTYDCQLIVTLSNGQKQESAVKPFTLNDYLIVIIGDSAAAGQGNPDKFGKPKEFGDDISGWNILNPAAWLESAWDSGWNWLKQNFTTLARAADAEMEMNPAPVWLEKNAYRSLRSGAALAAQLQEDPRHGNVVTLLHFARSGSDIKAGLFGPRTVGGKKIDGWIGNIGQLEELRRTVGKQRIDALIISIGVNDAGFTGNLETMVKGDNAFLGSGNDTKVRKKVMGNIKTKLAQLKENFSALHEALSEFNIAQVYITEYPTGIFDKMKNGRPVPSEGCEIFQSNFDMDITPRDAEDLKTAANWLNDTVRDAAKEHSWVYVGGIAEQFAGHGYCSGKNRLFRTASESLVLQGDTEGTMHPNIRGHQLIAQQISKEIRQRLKTHRVVVKPGERVERPKADKVRDHRDRSDASSKSRPSRPSGTRPARPQPSKVVKRENRK